MSRFSLPNIGTMWSMTSCKTAVHAVYLVLTRPREYKTFFVLILAKHEISNAYKCLNIKKLSFFSGSGKP